jgi:GAF domain-containing protein
MTADNDSMRTATGQEASLSELRATLDRMRAEHAQAQAALREESRLLEILNQTGQSIASQLDIEKLLQTVTDAATSLTGARFGAFFYNRVNEQGQDYLLYTLSGAPREAFEKFGHPRATAVFAPTFRGEATVRSDDITQDPRYGTMAPHHGMPPGHLPVRSYLAVPVKSRLGEVLGGLFLGHPETGRFNERTGKLIEGVAAQAAIAIDNARMYEAAQAQIANRQRAEASLRDSDRRKDEFLATLAHELRNPLAPIRQAVTISQNPAASDAEGLEPRSHHAAGAAHVAAARRPARHLAYHPRHARVAPQAHAAREYHRVGGGDGASRHRRQAPLARRTPAAAAGAAGCGSAAALAGALEPADQRRQVHRSRRSRPHRG